MRSSNLFIFMALLFAACAPGVVEIDGGSAKGSCFAAAEGDACDEQETRVLESAMLDFSAFPGDVDRFSVVNVGAEPVTVSLLVGDAGCELDRLLEVRRGCSSCSVVEEDLDGGCAEFLGEVGVNEAMFFSIESPDGGSYSASVVVR